MENKLLERISVLSLILLILFGILQYIPENRKYDSINIELILKVFSESFFQIMLFFALIYLILVAMNLSDNMKDVIPQKILEWIYSLIVFANFLAILFLTSLLLMINVVIYIPFFTAKMASYLLIIWIIFLFISAYIISLKYIFKKKTLTQSQ